LAVHLVYSSSIVHVWRNLCHETARDHDKHGGKSLRTGCSAEE
jgi:hypothetical protein